MAVGEYCVEFPDDTRPYGSARLPDSDDVLAKWIATGPKLLILDIPTVGVDVAAKDGIYEVVKALAAKGVAILLISDEIPEVFYHAHRVIVMRRGRLAGERIPHASSEAELQALVDA
jgi:simple sugar transport system ATP-binding protein